MSETKIEFISAGFREILLSDGVKSLVESEATKIRDRANGNITEESEGYRVKVYQSGYGGGRWIGKVDTTDFASMAAESEYKALSKAVK